jgi:hypothetical protein
MKKLTDQTNQLRPTRRARPVPDQTGAERKLSTNPRQPTLPTRVHSLFSFSLRRSLSLHVWSFGSRRNPALTRCRPRSVGRRASFFLSLSFPLFRFAAQRGQRRKEGERAHTQSKPAIDAESTQQAGSSSRTAARTFSPPALLIPPKPE